MQINKNCNENIGRVDNELKLLATSKKFPEDNVVCYSIYKHIVFTRNNFIEFNSC